MPLWLGATKDRVIVAIPLERCEKPDQQYENIENHTPHFLDGLILGSGPPDWGEGRAID
jgi:hypothetical protein